MKNRITRLLQNWNPDVPSSGPAQPGEPPVRENQPRGPYRMPRCVNMLMPVELCVNRSLLVSLLSASIVEMGRHKKAEPRELTGSALAEVEAALQQQLVFRTWLKEHPASFVCMALYPVNEADTLDDLDDLDDLPLDGFGPQS